MNYEALLAALGDVVSAWPALKPPNRVRPSDGAAEVMRIVRPGGGSGPYKLAETPYMVEPLDTMGSRRHDTVCFVGGAQAGKTAAMCEGMLAHTIVNDPGDTAIVQMTQDKAREYSRQRIDRMIRNSPRVRELVGRSQDDNTHDKSFRNGMIARLLWPTVTNLSSSSYRFVIGTDYDRWPDDIDGEGDGYGLMLNRIKTYMSRGCVGVESTPGRPIEDPNWEPSTPHEAPPVKGVLGIYNRSDRRRWYWKCPHCGDWMQASPGLGLFNLPPEDELLEGIRRLDIDAFVRQRAQVVCPNSGCIVAASHRYRMNLGGRWLADGLTIDDRDRISGTPRVSKIAGFWLGGVAAAYLSWDDLVRRYMLALLEYAQTGSELPLQVTTNTDQGRPYTARHLVEAGRKAGSHPRDRAEPDLKQYIVPAWARFVICQVDVQGGTNARFIVQAHAVGENNRQALIDRYAITESKRDGYGGPAPLDPAGHAEDWDLLTEKVVQATYRCENSDRELRVFRTIVDTGGEDGVTPNAYAWYRRARRDGYAQRVVLSKGDKKGKINWLVRETMVGGPKGTKGDVPLKLLNACQFKDQVFNGFRRTVPGPGYYHIPAPRSVKNPDGWLLETWFDELYAETRNPDGSYTQHKPRNEALDLCYMALALLEMLGVNKPHFWSNPPAWALPPEANSEALTREERRAEKTREPIQRRSSRSGYLS